MGHRLVDDPEWRRYEWELQHLPFVVLKQEIAALGFLCGELFMPAMARLSKKLASWGVS